MVISGVKLAEDGSGRLVLHAYALHDAAASVTFPSGAKQARFCDLHEQPGDPVDLTAIPVRAGHSYQFIVE